MGLSGKVLTPEQMVNQIQTTLAIEILYYLVVTAIKISILCFYLRIGMQLPNKARHRANNHNSGRQAPRDSQQIHNLLPRNFLLHLHSRLSHAMRPTAQDVGFHRLSGGQMHKHHGAILLSVRKYPFSSYCTYSPSTSHIFHQHLDRHLYSRPSYNNAPQDPTPETRKGRPGRHLQPRRLQLHRIHRAATLNPHLHRVEGPVLRYRAHQSLEHGRGPHRHLLRIYTSVQSALLAGAAASKPDWRIPVPQSGAQWQNWRERQQWLCAGERVVWHERC
jgi:hypothetical protein